MSTKLTRKNSKTADRDENANPSLTSDSACHRKAMTLDYMTEQERQSRNDPSKRGQRINEKDPTTNSGGKLTGHVNVLFFFDEDNVDDSPRLTVECGRQIGGRGNAQGQLQEATDVQFMDDSLLLVTDLVNSRLQIFNETGNVTTTIQAEELVEPWASAITQDGRVAVTSRKTKKVIFLGRDGLVKGSFGEGKLSCPSGIALTPEGYFIVTDFETSQVLVFDPSGTLVRDLGAGLGVTFYQPRYVTVSRHGDVIVSDSGNHRLVIFDKEWNFVKSFGKFGKQDGCLKFPHATCTDDLGNILVCDRYNDRVSVFTRKGDFVRHLVTSAHKLRHPQGLALSPGRQLYVSQGDLKANTILVFSLTVQAADCVEGAVSPAVVSDDG